MAFQVSPGVSVSEVDLSTTIPTASVSDAGFAGYFSKGPVDKIVTIGSENDLVKIFGEPVTGTNDSDWLTISSFLAYGGSIQVVRNADTDVSTTALNSCDASGTPALIKSKEDFEVGTYSDITFAARTAGEWGNDITVVILDSRHDVDAEGKLYNAPKIEDADTTACHIIIVIGEVKPENVVETHYWLDTASSSKDESGNSNYYKNVLNEKSEYVYTGSADITVEDFAGDGYQTIALSSGANGTVVTKDYELFEDTDQVDLSLVISGTDGAAAAITLATGRKDCVAFVSPEKSDVNTNSNQSVKADAVVAGKLSLTLNSYGFMDSGWKKMYDKYNDTWVKVPLNGDIAGLCVATDNNREPWYSPAGFSRGQIRNCAGLLFDPNKTSRDSLYKQNINPVASFPGEGYVLFGDKTLQRKPSAFDRLNVRRLFIVLEKAISNAAKYSLFEFNDEFTRGQFVSLVDPFLRNIKGRRGIHDYLLVCDESNNTEDIIDNNQFVGDVFIKPTRSINFIQLNFVAVRTGVSFSEIVGAV